MSLQDLWALAVPVAVAALRNSAAAWESRLHRVAVHDLHSRRIVGRSMSDHTRTSSSPAHWRWPSSHRRPCPRPTRVVWT
jgi:hypothetical protein